uniref:NADH-ubiquinone oxidoreductase chain 3 n=1 Tax=Trioza erytreae TaxID=1778831 RepID=A0A344A2U6_TRIEB|nr:NADH dehydrogenase subunit 3 [Trioza erytreae]AWU49087.1 NADH dehydrogenase subunit 3 [Trioza erytreae]
MNLMMMFITFVFIIMIMINFIIPMMNMHKIINREKNSPFECGFDPFSSSRVSFSIHFFSISLMFLIFDIEITLIMPLPIMKSLILMKTWMTYSIMMMILLLIGLMMEWKEGSMEWK